MIFLTVGTQFPFERLVKAVDDAAGKNLFGEEVFAQIGQSRYKPENIKAAASLDKNDFDRHFRKASVIISHAGMGSITLAMEQAKPLLGMPRRGKYGEVVNDHQVAISVRYEKMGYLLVAFDPTDLPGKINELKVFTPKKREIKLRPVLDRVREFINQLV